MNTGDYSIDPSSINKNDNFNMNSHFAFYRICIVCYQRI